MIYISGCVHLVKETYLNLRYTIYIIELKRFKHIMLKILQKINLSLIALKYIFSWTLDKLKMKIRIEKI